MGKVVEVETILEIKPPKPCSMMLYSVDEFCDVWPLVEEMLDKVPHTWRRWTKSAIYDAVVENRMQMWGVGPNETTILVILTMVNVFPAMRVLTLFWTGGTLTEEMPALVERTLTMYARFQNCQEAEVLGRFGWEPIMRKQGFTREAVFLTKPILDVHLH